MERDAAPVIEAILADGHALRIPVRGVGMHPALREGDVAVIAPFLGLPRIGQIVLARSAEGPLLARLVDVELQAGRRMYRLKDDAEGGADAGVMREELYGRLIAVERDGRCLDADDPAFAPPGRSESTGRPMDDAVVAVARRRR
ncbi:MAG TPA: S24/S26 family peptidase [Candidatus Polarisedimenticolia bacterium]|nr:S24/S26 family peptidase [Candidatus Polarisedimenticolia bacterium]